MLGKEIDKNVTPIDPPNVGLKRLMSSFVCLFITQISNLFPFSFLFSIHPALL